MLVSKIILFSFGIACASAGFSQYYVTPHFASHFSPAVPLVHQQQISQNSIFDVPSFYHSQPLLFSQNLNPFVQQSFVSSIPQINVEQARSNNRQGSGRSQETAPLQPQGTEYGFGYRTLYDDGASSTVVFVTGAESKRMNLLRNDKATARKLASDILDAKTPDEKNEKIDHALSDSITGLNFDSLIQAFPAFKPLERHESGVIHLFSHPADVFPLSTSSDAITTSTPESTTTSETVSDDDSESIAIESADSDTPLARSSDNSAKEAESIIQETKIRIEGIKNRSLNEKSSTEKSTQTSTTEESTINTTSKDEEEETTTQQK